MGRKEFNRQFDRQWARPEDEWHQHRGRGGGGGRPSWGGFGGPGGPGGFGRAGGHGGPPPWVAGLFGLAQGEGQRGPRVRRGDVRMAILDVVRTGGSGEGEQLNGYQVIQEIAARSNDQWRPSPGSVYPTIQQLQDEGLVETDEGPSRRALRLTPEGEAYVAEHADELDAVWKPFRSRSEQSSDFAGLKPEIGQVMGAVWQIVSTGSEQQRRAAVEVLVETRRKLYGILADGELDEADETGTSGPGAAGSWAAEGDDPA